MESIINHAFAAVDAAKFGGVLDPIIEHIVNPIVEILFATGILVFVWGVAQMIIKGDDPEARKNAKTHMLAGAFGMFIMVSAWGIIRLIASTISGI